MENKELHNNIKLLRYGFGSIIYILSYSTLNRHAGDAYGSYQNALKQVHFGMIGIVLALFLIYPIFKNVSKVVLLNYIRFIFGIGIFLKFFKQLTLLIMNMLDLISWYYATDSIVELLLNNVGFGAYFTQYTAGSVIGFLIIAPFIRIINYRLTLKFTYGEDNEEVEKGTIVSDVLKSFFVKISTFITEKLKIYSKDDSNNRETSEINVVKEVTETENTAINNNVSIKIAELTKLRELLDSGVISEEEFIKLKEQLLN